ncbi:hypothetical protein [Nonomuraea cavernae]|uniref:Uncharacterized protein n=1 Tax=Nonomuraea cavernae TaxID=2045107 RepID=A0A917Z0H1_9ACTN|nr:hypothetical protein [Nonomuraea cavernae]MCA2187764.1 hypothetical protein [Nonomuraea cavernae]GGO71783.1 hypothetical protein GCM10012289_38270 [Nonomuraea cavernae]
MIASLRYEFAMQVRRPLLWIVYGLVLAMMVAVLDYWSLDLGVYEVSVPKEAMGVAAQIIVTLLPIVYGCMLADRPSRDRVLRRCRLRRRTHGPGRPNPRWRTATWRSWTAELLERAAGPDAVLLRRAHRGAMIETCGSAGRGVPSRIIR